MTVQSLIPSGLKKFKAEKPYINEYETSISLRYDKPHIKNTPKGVVGRDFIVISKNKSSDVYHAKFYFEDGRKQQESYVMIQQLINSTDGLDYANEPAFTGGMLYQIWGRRNYSGKPYEPVAKTNAKIERILKTAIKNADRIA